MKSLFIACTLGFNCYSQISGSGVTDVVGNTYQTVIIGTQEWMAENLRTSKYSNGTNIPYVSDAATWDTNTTGARVFYNNDSQFYVPYGYLYNWYAVGSQNNLCPVGWHVPTDDDWSILVTYLDPNVIDQNLSLEAGGPLKELGTQHWLSPNTGATNSTGFTGLPGGHRWNGGVWNQFSDISTDGYYWTSTLNNFGNALSRILENSENSLFRYPFYKSEGHSVRCIRNNNVGVIELNEPKEKELVKIIDLVGRETSVIPNVVLIYLYSDGSTERKLFLGE